jgi:hypothetical protein
MYSCDPIDIIGVMREEKVFLFSIIIIIMDEKVGQGPWVKLDYPPQNPQAIQDLSYLSCTPHEPSDQRFVENATVDYQLSEWWMLQSKLDAVTQQSVPIPWGGVMTYRFPDNDFAQTQRELDEPGRMSHWKHCVGAYDALLLYQFKTPTLGTTDSKGVEKHLLIWGILERTTIEKFASAPGNSECAAPILHQSTVPTSSQMISPKYRFVQSGRDRWIYPLVTCNPKDYGEREEKALDDLDLKHDAYSHISEHFGALVRELLEFEKLRSPNYKVTYDEAVCKHYLAHLNLSDPVVRIVDWRLRKHLFLYTLITKEPDARVLLENIGARLVQTIVEIGWPHERMVTYLAKRGRLDSHRIDLRQHYHPNPTIHHEPKLLLTVRHPGHDVAESNPFVVMPGDTMIELEQRFRMITQKLRRQLFVFDDDEDTGWTRDATLLVSQRYRSQNIDRLVVVSKRADPCCWRLQELGADQSDLNPTQSIFDEFPTRVFLLFPKERSIDSCRALARKGLNIIQSKLRPAAVALSSTARLNPWTQKSASEGVRWLNTIEVYTEARAYNIVLFPYVVLESLSRLRLLLQEMQSLLHPHFYVDRSVICLPPDRPERVLQPSLAQLKSMLGAVPSITLTTDNAQPFTHEQLQIAVEHTLDRFEVEPECSRPTVAWVRSVASFAANPPEDAPDTRSLAPIVSSDAEVLAQTGRVACEGLLVTYREYGYWLGSEYRLFLRSEFQILERDHSGDLMHYLRTRHHLEQEQVEAIRAIFAPPNAKKHRKNGLNRNGLASSTTIITTIIDETSRNSMLEEVSTLKHIDDEERDRQRIDASRTSEEHARSQWQLYMSRTPQIPGSDEERNRWWDFTETRPVEYLNFLFGRDVGGDDPKTSIKITDDSAKGFSRFAWRDYKNERFTGGGPYNLAVYAYFIEHIGSDQVPLLQRAKEAHTGKNGSKRWNDVARDAINRKLSEEFFAKYERDANATSLTLHYIVNDQAQRFFEQYHTSLDAVAPTPSKKKAPVSEAGREKERQQLRHWYDESVPIDGTIGQTYLRGTEQRGLFDLNKDILERSPHLRFHPAFPYTVQEERQKVSTHFGAILCFCYNEAEQCYVGMQAIYLDPKTKGKVVFKDTKANPAKKSRGSLSLENAFFMVQPGRLGKIPWVFLAEGPETAWSVAAVSRYFCVYASFGVGNFSRFNAHKAPGMRLCLCLDRSPNKKSHIATMNACAAAGKKLAAAGWEMVGARIPDCDDGCKVR